MSDETPASTPSKADPPKGKKLPPGWEWDAEHSVYRKRELVRLSTGEKVRLRSSGKTMALARAEFERKRQEAEDEARNPTAAVDTGPNGSKLFAVYAEEWLTTYPSTVKNRENTKIEKAYHVRVRIVPYFDRLGKERGRPFTLADITQRVTDKFIADLNDSTHLDRDTKLIEWKGQSKTLTEWASKLKMDRETLAKRLARGQTIEHAFSAPLLAPRGRYGKGKLPTETGRKLSPKSVRNIAQTFRQMLQCAKRWGEIASVPEVPKVKLPKGKFDFLSFAEHDALLGAGAGSGSGAPMAPEDYALLLTGTKAGPRPGELLGLQWPAVDFKNSTIRFDVQISRRRIALEPVKAGERTVPMSPKLAAALKRIQHLRYFKPGAAHGSGPSNDGYHFVFCDGNGRPWSRTHLRKTLEKHLRRAKIRNMSPHKLRHTYASHLAMLGWPLQEIQALLGHSSIAMTMKYAHLMPKHGWDKIKMLDALPKGEEA